MGVADLRAPHCRSYVVRHRFASGLRGSGNDRGEGGNLFGGRRSEVGRHRKLIVEAARVEHRDLGSLTRSLANAMSENRYLTPQVGSDNEQRAQLVDGGDAHPEIRVDRVRILVAQIALTHPVLDVARDQPASDAGGEIT